MGEANGKQTCNEAEGRYASIESSPFPSKEKEKKQNKEIE